MVSFWRAWRPSASVRSAGARGFLGRLAADTRGNALAIIAAAVIPLIAMVGSGVDLSRAYLARTRLQQACDAGVIAGRKVMGDSVDATVTAEVRKFVNFNFPQGTLQTTAFTIVPTEGTNESVDLSLSTTMPTALMKIVGFTTFGIDVNCTARQDFVNTDVMMVLDVTKSMDDEIDGTKKIAALRSAVAALYRALKPAQDKLENASLRLRYGIVPYSSTVNVGKLLYAKNTSWIRNPYPYQKCVSSNWSGCTNYDPVSVTHSNNWFNSTWGGCIEERATVNSIRSSTGYTAPSGAYDLDVDAAPTNDATRWGPYDPAAVEPENSSACPKGARLPARFATEADITSWVSAANGFVPVGSTYHDIGLIWGARLISSTGLWATDNPDTFNSFPVNRHLIFMTDGELAPTISTYSAYGVERYDRRVTSSSNTSTMADEQYESHRQRGTRIMCNKIKSMNITLWVVAFGTTLTDELRSCASSPNHASESSNSAALIQRFQQIGQDIGALRLSR